MPKSFISMLAIPVFASLASLAMVSAEPPSTSPAESMRSFRLHVEGRESCTGLNSEEGGVKVEYEWQLEVDPKLASLEPASGPRAKVQSGKAIEQTITLVKADSPVTCTLSIFPSNISEPGNDFYMDWPIQYKFPVPRDQADVYVQLTPSIFDARALGRKVGGKLTAKVTSYTEVVIVIDKDRTNEVVRESAPITVPQGATEVKREEYTVRKSLSVATGWNVQGEGKARAYFVELGIMAGLSRTSMDVSEESTTSTREVTVPGNGRAYKVVWMETFKTGKAFVRTQSDGPITEIPFKFREGWDLRVIDAK
ncbi:MAG TPA: hypothetical protein PLR25_15125 [Planctomycetaceae bacterium]|nr:hypothetical protein [Planctomycetaceae bacterium]